MRRIAPAVAVVVLVAIGAAEARVSVEQLAATAGRPRLETAGLTLTAAGLLASAAIYILLGFFAHDDATALRAGAITGAVAGLVGGAVRAFIIGETVTDLVTRYAAVPDVFVAAALVVFVGLSCAVSVAGGAALAWTGRRLSRAARSRPPA